MQNEVSLTLPSSPSRSPPTSHLADPDGPLLAPPNPGEPIAAADPSLRLASLDEDAAAPSPAGTEPAAFNEG